MPKSPSNPASSSTSPVRRTGPKHGRTPRSEFERRRRTLARMMGRGGIAILPAGPVRTRNNDVEYPYRQDSDFHYLTGFDEPEAVAVQVPGRAAAESILFVRDREPLREPRPAGARETLH
jgi:Xaa-Pro aminopeptidase